MGIILTAGSQGSLCESGARNGRVNGAMGQRFSLMATTNKMADGGGIYEELTRLRLKLIEQASRSTA